MWMELLTHAVAALVALAFGVAGTAWKLRYAHKLKREPEKIDLDLKSKELDLKKDNIELIGRMVEVMNLVETSGLETEALRRELERELRMDRSLQSIDGVKAELAKRNEVILGLLRDYEVVVVAFKNVAKQALGMTKGGLGELSKLLDDGQVDVQSAIDKTAANILMIRYLVVPANLKIAKSIIDPSESMVPDDWLFEKVKIAKRNTNWISQSYAKLLERHPSEEIPESLRSAENSET